MNYHSIKHCNMVNGDGLRTVIWLSGCSHRCEGCFNSETWDPHSGSPFGESARRELFKHLSEDWCSGITFTGGDPLHESNIGEVASLAKEIKEKYPTKTIWMYTGYVWDELIHDPMRSEVLKYVDVLVDGPFVESMKTSTKHWVGSSNQNVIYVRDRLETLKKILE